MVLAIDEREIPEMSNGIKFHRLLSHLPLFQGMSLSELDNVIAKVRLGFYKAKSGDIIADEGQLTDGLTFVVDGSVTAETYADDRGYSIVEWLPVPCVFQPERTFGFTQRYSRIFRAESDCSILYIGKSDVLLLASSSEVFRLNLLNIVSTMTQKLQRLPWRTIPAGVRRKIFSFVENRSMRPAGEKVLNIGMVRLGNEIGESRLNVSIELKALDNEGLIVQKKNKIIIPALEIALKMT